MAVNGPYGIQQSDVHTLLWLPTCIVYAQGVKANVAIFDRKPAREQPWTEKLWIYDLRTNMHLTLKENLLARGRGCETSAFWDTKTWPALVTYRSLREFSCGLWPREPGRLPIRRVIPRSFFRDLTMPRAAIPGPFASGAKWLLAFLLLAGEMLQAAPLQAVVSGGRISGDWGGTAFADASYTVTAGYHPNLVQSGTLAGFPAAFVSATPTLTIDTGSGLLSGTLQPFAGFTWHLFSLAVTANDSRSGFAPIDASLNVTNAFDIEAALPQSTLLAQVAFGGDSDANDPVTWQTSLGVLEISASTDAAGTFAIVPEPSTAAALGIAVVAIACRRRFISG